jgi:hypothetical protein
MSTIADICCPRLKYLRPILEKWSCLNKRIFKSWQSEGDAPWWYNERASLSTLSGAIWLSGGIVLEEYSDEKRRVSRKSGRISRPYSGRVDIYFEYNGHEFKGETKFCCPGASTMGRDQTGYMTNFIEEAKKDIRKSHPDGMRRLAIVFMVPYVSKKQKHGIKERVYRIVQQIKKLEPDAFAWVFPDIENAVSLYGWLYPGTAVVIKEVKR